MTGIPKLDLPPLVVLEDDESTRLVPSERHDLPVNAAIEALTEILDAPWSEMTEEWQKAAKTKLLAVQIALSTATKVDTNAIQKQRADVADELFQSLLETKARLDARRASVELDVKPS